MLADGELPGIVAQYHGVTCEAMCLGTAPDGSLGGDLYWIGSRSEPMPRKAVSGLRRDGQAGEPNSVELRRPGGLIGEGRPRLLIQPGDQGRGQRPLAHVIERCGVEHEVGVAGTQQIQEVQSALRGPCAEPGEMLIADLRAVAILGLMPRAGVVH